MNNITANLDTDKFYAEAKRFYLAGSNRLQGKAICNHYIKLFYTVKTLQDVIEFKESCSGKDIDLKPIEEYIDYLVDKIKEEHEKDFGIKLEWNIENE